MSSKSAANTAVSRGSMDAIPEIHQQQLFQSADEEAGAAR